MSVGMVFSVYNKVGIKLKATKKPSNYVTKGNNFVTAHWFNYEYLCKNNTEANGNLHRKPAHTRIS